MSHPAGSYKLTSEKAIERLRAVVDDPGDHSPIDVAFAVLILELVERSMDHKAGIVRGIERDLDLMAKVARP